MAISNSKLCYQRLFCDIIISNTIDEGRCNANEAGAPAFPQRMPIRIKAYRFGPTGHRKSHQLSCLIIACFHIDFFLLLHQAWQLGKM